MMKLVILFFFVYFKNGGGVYRESSKEETLIRYKRIVGKFKNSQKLLPLKKFIALLVYSIKVYSLELNQCNEIKEKFLMNSKNLFCTN